MRGEGFEPSQVLNHLVLSQVRLTTPASPRKFSKKIKVLNLPILSFLVDVLRFVFLFYLLDSNKILL